MIGKGLYLSTVKPADIPLPFTIKRKSVSKVFTITEGLENMGAIRTGGQGSVYKGRRVGEIITAIKLLPTPIFSQSDEDKHYRDFSNEVRKLQRVNEIPNPNIVKILSYGVSETGCFPFIEMEYIDGPDLCELLKSPHPAIFPVKDVITVAEHLSNALAHCHRLDVKHGDIKSNNVKFNQHTGNYVLLDFGLAVLSDEERRTSLRQAGAIEFMAPEQNEGRSLFETDVYSFGIILFELLAGKVPFPLDGNTETARNRVMVAHMETPPPDLLSLRASMLPEDWSDEWKAKEMLVPEWLMALIDQCLQKKPEDRFENGMALQEFIQHHRIYTAEVASLVKNEDDRWKAVLAEKTDEIQDLRAIISRQDKELQLVRQRNAAQPRQSATPNTVPRSTFHALLLALLVLGALAVYGLFFQRSVVGGANANTEVFRNEDTLAAKPEKTEIASVEKQVAADRAAARKRLKGKDSTNTAKAVLPPPDDGTADKETDTTGSQQPEEQKTETLPDSTDNTKKKETARVVRFKVRNRAYFHDEPTTATKREAFITHWDAPVKALDEKNGFIYIVFTNEDGQTTKGWISKADLVAAK